MKTILFKFTNPLDDLDYKKKNNIKIEESGAVYNDGERCKYSSRRRVIDVIRAAYKSGNLLAGKKIVTNDTIEYTYILCIGQDEDKQIKGKIIVKIPTKLALLDPEVHGQTKVLDIYEGKAIKNRKKRNLAIALISSATLISTIGGTFALIKGIDKEETARIKKDKEYEDEYQRSKKREDIEQGRYKEEYAISPITYYVPEECTIYKQENEKEKTKTLK